MCRAEQHGNSSVSRHRSSRNRDRNNHDPAQRHAGQEEHRRERVRSSIELAIAAPADRPSAACLYEQVGQRGERAAAADGTRDSADAHESARDAAGVAQREVTGCDDSAQGAQQGGAAPPPQTKTSSAQPAPPADKRAGVGLQHEALTDSSSWVRRSLAALAMLPCATAGWLTPRYIAACMVCTCRHVVSLLCSNVLVSCAATLTLC